MTTLDVSDALPLPAMPVRPKRPLSVWQILKTRGVDSLELCDEALFDELFVERRALWLRVFVVSDPQAIRHVLIDNFANYRRHFLMRQPIAPGLGSGMLINDGAIWRRHRRLVNPLLDHQATLPDAPMLIASTEKLAQHLAELPRGEEIDIGEQLALLITISVGHVFAGADADVLPMLSRMARFPGAAPAQRLPADPQPASCLPDPRRGAVLVPAARSADRRAAQPRICRRAGSDLAAGPRSNQ
jgi:cytochrome P450